MLRRDELVAEITERGGDVGAEPEEAPEPKEPPERRREAKPERERLEDTETEDVVGVLEVTPQRYGFLRFGGLEAQPDDVYVSASQIRRCELRSGDEVGGPARAPRRGERAKQGRPPGAGRGRHQDALAEGKRGQQVDRPREHVGRLAEGHAPLGQDGRQVFERSALLGWRLASVDPVHVH